MEVGMMNKLWTSSSFVLNVCLVKVGFFHTLESSLFHSNDISGMHVYNK